MVMRYLIRVPLPPSVKEIAEKNNCRGVEEINDTVVRAGHVEVSVEYSCRKSDAPTSVCVSVYYLWVGNQDHSVGDSFQSLTLLVL